jgi:membrane protein required for colicin V production
MRFEIIDIIFAVITALIVIRCGLRGLIEELLSMASLVLGLLAAFFFYKAGGDFIRARFMPGMEIIPNILAFIGLFVIVLIVVKILQFILQDILNRINLGGLDRFLGLLFGLLEGIVLVSLILFILSIQPLFDERALLENSFFARYLEPLIGVVEQSLGSGGA